MDRITVDYLVRGSREEAKKTARAVAFEQTVELPEALVTSPAIRKTVVGRVEAVRALPRSKNRWRLTLSFNSALAGGNLSQFLNLIYGNISIQRGIRLADLRVPESFLRGFRGPTYGVEGLRRLIGVRGRPLLATALKPMGSSHPELASLAGAFALGGGDIVKDDQNLVDATPEDFKDRVSRCLEAVEAANARTGRRTLYLPIISARHEEVEERIDYAVKRGARGILICPFLTGLDYTRRLAEKYSMVIMAHPAFTGTFFQDPGHGIEPAILLGRFMRLIGADISIFPNFGGRFPFTREECAAVAERLREPLGALAPAFPAPAGGMRFENLGPMAEQYGPDSVFLIGGGLLGHGKSVEAGARAFLDKIRERFSERLETPAEASASACELPAGPGSKNGAADFLPFLKKNYAWEGRAPTAYKKSAALPFRGVARHELVGQHGERQAFELRYFEIAPGGYTSLEKHVHTHTIVCLRGDGIVLKNGRRVNIRPFDIATVGPLETHQLRNESSGPFGFFCIVDRERDRPMKP